MTAMVWRSADMVYPRLQGSAKTEKLFRFAAGTRMSCIYFRDCGRW